MFASIWDVEPVRPLAPQSTADAMIPSSVGPESFPADLVAMSQIPDSLQAVLRERLDGAAHLPAEDVALILDRHEMTIEQLMVVLLPFAAERARAPVSGFQVGAVAMGMPPVDDAKAAGALYLGANLEFAGLPLSMTVHAEQAAVNNAMLNNEQGLLMLAVTAAPCGHCRQFLNELTTAEHLEVLVAPPFESGLSRSKVSLTSLLPMAFGPSSLGIQRRLLSFKVYQDERSDGSLKEQAMTAGILSNAPYSGNRSGFAINTKSSGAIWGRTAECAAYNPSLTAMQSALSSLAMRTTANFREEITAACLAERPTSVSQRSFSELLLSSINPKLVLEYQLIHFLTLPTAPASD